jgi:hypothetical protein
MAEDVQSGAVLPAYCLSSAFSAARVMKRLVPGRKDVQSGALPSRTLPTEVGLDRSELDYWPAG